MNHLPFIVASYAIFAAATLAMAAEASLRLRRSTTRLQALDARQQPGRPRVAHRQTGPQQPSRQQLARENPSA